MRSTRKPDYTIDTGKDGPWLVKPLSKAEREAARKLRREAQRNNAK